MIQQPEKPDRPSDDSRVPWRDRLRLDDPAREEAFDAQELAVLRRQVVTQARSAVDRQVSSWGLGRRWIEAAAVLVVAVLVALAFRQDGRRQQAQETVVRAVAYPSVVDETPEPQIERSGNNAESAPETTPPVSSERAESIDRSTRLPIPEALSEISPQEIVDAPTRVARATPPVEPQAPVGTTAAVPEPTSANRQIRFRGPNGTQVIWNVATEQSR